MTPKQQAYEVQANTIIKNLKRRRMNGYYCATVAEATELAMSMVQPGDTVTSGGSMTLEENDIVNALRSRDDITLYDNSPKLPGSQKGDIYRAAFSCKKYFMSTNAITLDGELVNIDGSGNRVAALIYGPEKVIIVAGMNKVASNVEDAIDRVHNIASPPNCIRLNRQTPCALTGKCGDCLGDDSICSQTVITRRSADPDRIHVILVGEELGY